MTEAYHYFVVMAPSPARRPSGTMAGGPVSPSP